MGVERGCWRGRRSGATVVEMAIVLNLLLLIILGTFESGRLLMTRHLIANAAREAARTAVSGTYDVTEEEIRQVAYRVIGPVADDSATVYVYQADAQGGFLGPWDHAGFGERIAVRVEVQYIPVMPGFGILPDAIPLRSVVMMRSEGD